MTQTYQISGMTCNGCVATVQRGLLSIPHVQQVDIDLPSNKAAINVDEPIAISQLQQALQKAGNGKYSIHEVTVASPTNQPLTEPINVATYKPLLLVLAYIGGFTLLAEIVAGQFIWMRWMNHFMAAFFITFSFFKMLDLQGFAESYSSYDVIARRWQGWGFIYAFIELFLGASYFTSFQPVVTNTITLVVMIISIVGVLQSVLAKRKIKCACLGTVFNLPMSTVTIIEDGLMIGMSAVALVSLV